jgi:hypothetical protein
MLTKLEVENLAFHVAGIFQTVILPEITPEGCILVREPDGHIAEDYVSTHHLVELCLELDRHLTGEIVKASCQWFTKNHGDTRNPFTLTTLTDAGYLTGKSASDVEEAIIESQRPSGHIELYSGFLDGGSIFSTLWAIRILLSLRKSATARSAITRAFAAIEDDWKDIHRMSFKGYYCELRWLFGLKHKSTPPIGRILREILASQGKSGLWDQEALYTAYILGNLAMNPQKPSPKEIKALDSGFRLLFDLSEEPKSLPNAFQEVRQKYHESVYLQLCCRAIISACRYLRRYHSINIAERIAAIIMGSYPNVYHTARRLGAELKRMDTQYGAIQSRFSHLSETAEKILRESRYEKNVFVMMPFRQDRDERYEQIENIIRAELKKSGYCAWLASDRMLAPQLWDNVVSFLLACKFGIAVFTRMEKERTIEEEFNPNVSLELGFCLSRGKNILILKDKALSHLQTDLVGHLYKQFDLNQVRRQLPRLLRSWIKEIGKEDAKEEDDKPQQGHPPDRR